MDLGERSWYWFFERKKMPLKNTENILVFYKKPPVYNPQMREGKPYKITQGGDSSNYGDYHRVVTENSGERYPVNLIKFNRDKNTVHPTQKPIALLEYLIKTYSNEGDLILDNCMGSGSTCVAAKNLNRKYIGIELDEKYFEIAKGRLEV